jgi:hypothetical protein
MSWKITKKNCSNLIMRNDTSYSNNQLFISVSSLQFRYLFTPCKYLIRSHVCSLCILLRICVLLNLSYTDRPVHHLLIFPLYIVCLIFIWEMMSNVSRSQDSNANHDPNKQEVGFIFAWSGSELRSLLKNLS